jgi:hypothetical protein
MILGAVAGGMIVLLVQEIQGEKETIRFSAAALGCPGSASCDRVACLHGAQTSTQSKKR